MVPVLWRSRHDQAGEDDQEMKIEEARYSRGS